MNLGGISGRRPKCKSRMDSKPFKSLAIANPMFKILPCILQRCDEFLLTLPT